jgi:vacuolar-type H+-ATPase subunit E/Vma4
MSTAPVTSKLAIVTAGEPTLFDSLARLVPEELQTAYYRVLAHTRTLSPDDEMLRILEAMGILALLTRHTPKDMADERERFQEILELHRRSSNEAQQKMREYLRALESRISALPSEIRTGLDPKEIAKLLGESLRQHFLQSGMQDTVKALEATSSAMTSAQKELSTALRGLSDSQGGVIAQVERANNRLEYSLESRARTFDALLHEWKSDLLRIWIPLIAGAAMLIGLFGGMEIQGCRDAASPMAVSPPTVVQPAPTPTPEGNGVPEGSSGKLHSRKQAVKPGVEHER